MSICNFFHQINEHFQLDPSDYLVFTTYFIRLMSIYKLIPSYLWAFTTWLYRQELSRFLFSCCLISSPLEGQLETNPDFFTKRGEESVGPGRICCGILCVAELWENELLLPVWAKCKLSVRKAVTFNFQLLVNLFTTLLKSFHRWQVLVQAD